MLSYKRQLSSLGSDYAARCPFITSTTTIGKRSKPKSRITLNASPQNNDNIPSLPPRLFSNIDPTTLKHAPGSVFSASLLVAGTTVGAGILALPAVTAPSGMIASWAALTFFALWSLSTGLIIAEVSLATLCEVGGGKGISLSSTAERTIGTAGSTTVSATYLLLHYTLLVAYTAKAGSTLTAVVPSMSLAVGEVAFVSILGLICFGTPNKTLENINNVLVLLFIGSFLALLSTAIPGVDVQQLLTASSPRWEALPPALPVIALAFVFQNTVPVVVSSLEGDPGKIRKSLCIGVFIAYLMFVSWNAAILGSSNLGGGDITAGGGGAIVDPLEALRSSNNPLLGPLVDTFSLLAVTTSFIGFVLGLSDFFADVLSLPTGTKSLPVFALTLVPPTVLAILFPDVFYTALDFAGTYGVLILFGLIPVAMAYGERRMEAVEEEGGDGIGGLVSSVKFVPGWLLPLLGAVPVVVIMDQLTSSLH